MLPAIAVGKHQSAIKMKPAPFWRRVEVRVRCCGSGFFACIWFLEHPSIRVSPSSFEKMSVQRCKCTRVRFAVFSGYLRWNKATRVCIPSSRLEDPRCRQVQQEGKSPPKNPPRKPPAGQKGRHLRLPSGPECKQNGERNKQGESCTAKSKCPPRNGGRVRRHDW